MDQNNASLRKCFIYIYLKNLSGFQIISGKFFWQESDSHIIPYCRENHICSRQLYIRRKLQSIF